MSRETRNGDRPRREDSDARRPGEGGSAPRFRYTRTGRVEQDRFENRSNSSARSSRREKGDRADGRRETDGRADGRRTSRSQRQRRGVQSDAGSGSSSSARKAGARTSQQDRSSSRRRAGSSSARGAGSSSASRLKDAARRARERAGAVLRSGVTEPPVADEKGLINREQFIKGAFGVLGAVALVRLTQVQLFQGAEYAEAAASRRTADITIPALRGAIYDRNGNVLATSVATKQVILNPSNATSDHTKLAEKVASVIGGDAKAYKTALDNSKSQYYLAARQVDSDVAAQLEGLDGVELVDDSKRVYPYGEVAGQVVGVSNTDGEGLTGLELKYNDILKGVDGSIVVQRGLYGQPIPGGVEKETPARNGQDIITSIDLELQQYAERKVQAAVDEWQADSGSFVVLDAATGEIYAIGSTPYLDASNYSKADSNAFQLKPVNSLYEPGSTFKCVTAAALVNEGAITPDTQISIPAALYVDDYRISDSHEHGAETVSFREVIAESLNTGTVIASRLIGSQKLYEYIGRFGFLEKPTVDYPGAARTLLLDVGDWNAATAANVPFGQGISVSMLQLTRALSALANKGVMCSPHLVISEPQNSSFSEDWPTETVVSEQTCATVTDMLKSVVTEGTGSNAAIDGYTVAGKTGTSQKIDEETGTYSNSEYVTSFFGWLPNTDCTLVCCIALDNPKTEAGGGLVAGPVFSNIMSFACDRYKVAPDLSSTASGVAHANEGAGA